ncbi:MAG TPA: hypothetical protein VN455_03975 [Methanotrichaceae archaeon]|nr:hypothetical protein [Methanotrichaceae archaeon]
MDSWNALADELESQAKSVQGQKMEALKLKGRVEKAISDAEAASKDPELISRLDLLLMDLTEASRQSACTNTRCPQYGKKCKMR